MSREKPIDEKHELSESIYMSGHGLDRKDGDDIAEQLYREGYRKQSEGEWRIDQHGNGWCSVCNHCGFLEEEDSTDYCPNCGARMKGGAE